MKRSFRVGILAGLAGLAWIALSANAAGQFRITGPTQVTAPRGNTSFRFVVGPAKQVENTDPSVKIRIAGSGGTSRLVRESELPRGRRYMVRIRGIRRNFTAVIVVKDKRSGRRATTERVRVQAE